MPGHWCFSSNRIEKVKSSSADHSLGCRFENISVSMVWCDWNVHLRFTCVLLTMSSNETEYISFEHIQHFVLGKWWRDGTLGIYVRFETFCSSFANLFFGVCVSILCCWHCRHSFDIYFGQQTMCVVNAEERTSVHTAICGCWMDLYFIMANDSRTR